MKKVHKELALVQKLLNAPKDKDNKFGGYKYRNAESIIAAYKALGMDECTLTMSDSMSLVGDRVFLIATAKFTCEGESIEVQGCAMHAAQKKGMDEAQITGACSSYARKYALCGLFAIDDSEHDPDGKDNSQHTSKQKPETPSQAAIDTAIDKVNSCESMEELQALYGGLYKNNKTVATHKDVVEAKDVKKSEFEHRDEEQSQ